MVKILSCGLCFLAFVLIAVGKDQERSPCDSIPPSQTEQRVDCVIRTVYPRVTAGRHGTRVDMGGYGIRRDAARALLSIADESPEARQRVVQELIRLLETPAMQDGFYYSAVWSCACSVLGSLKATEAIDVLSSHLDMQHGAVTLSLLAYPSASALVEIGEKAVPKLKEQLLRTDPRFGVRVLAAQALGDIGGEDAKEALEAGLTTEDNWFVRKMIEASLLSIDKQRTGK